ncbi:zinc ABC transporter substrate-binding protein [uncultured Pelagimonas sp.]|uniref:zinc ABC transporter substrate-binding protein n=1 Tax=uncultured Pelagimonas sp. TaxID=1618102 RepID=UPI00260E799D|nr:zinc ABC transporter substrate-binding protein [uncultured Pelagimonas sp.]
MILRTTSLALLLSTSAALAEVPKVVTDIPPIQSLVAMVMDQIGTPDLLIEPGASAHDLALKPSQAQMLSDADIVIWVGPELNPAVEGHVESLASKAVHLELMNAEGAHLLPYRDEAFFGDHHDAEDHEDHGDEDHDEDHKDHDDDHEKHDEHDEDHEEHSDDHHAHGDGEFDPHLWMSPENAVLWVNVIAQELAKIDQDNQDKYFYNATLAAEKIKAAQEQAQAILEPIHDVPLAAYHDAYQYFEDAFGLNVIGAISDSDAVQPGAKRIETLRSEFEQLQPKCFLMEPGANARLIMSVGWAGLLDSDSGKEPIARLDPLGGHLEQGAALYTSLIEDTAQRIADCVAD